MMISVEEKIAAVTENLFLIKIYWEVREPVQRLLFKSPSQSVLL